MIRSVKKWAPGRKVINKFGEALQSGSEAHDTTSTFYESIRFNLDLLDKEQEYLL